MDVIRMVHRFLGETLLLIALIGVILAIIGLIRKQEMARAERIFGLIYAGLLDLQALLGLVSFFSLLMLAGTGLLMSKFILHPILMILALVVVHASSSRRSGPVPARHWAQLVAYGLSLALVFAGRMILV
jgi:hypothetical protein